LQSTHGATTLEMRYKLAQKAFEHTAVYDRTIAEFLAARNYEEVKACYVSM